MKKRTLIIILVIIVVIISSIVYIGVQVTKQETDTTEYPTLEQENVSQSSVATDDYGWVDSAGSVHSEPLKDSGNKKNNIINTYNIISENNTYKLKLFILTETDYNQIYSILREDGTIWEIVYDKADDTYFYTRTDYNNLEDYQAYIDEVWDYDLYNSDYCNYIHAVLNGDVLNILERSDTMVDL